MKTRTNHVKHIEVETNVAPPEKRVRGRRREWAALLENVDTTWSRFGPFDPNLRYHHSLASRIRTGGVAGVKAGTFEVVIGADEQDGQDYIYVRRRTQE